MKATINKKKILYNQGRLICDGSGINFIEVKSKVEKYIEIIKKIKSNGFVIDQEKVNFGIRIELFKIPVTVGKLFEIYNELAEQEGYQVYSKLWYNPTKSCKFSPSNIS